jgi:membrane protease YdiL (CAAX protease family)
MASTIRADSSWKGPGLYLALTFALAWLPAFLLRDLLSGAAHGFAHPLLAASLLYTVTMGWQPLAATWLVRRWVDRPGAKEHGLHPARLPYNLLATFAPLVLAGAALLMSLAFGVSLLLIWLQALAEEIGWRGYFLTHLMRQLGPWEGLLLHGLFWGLWYAPPLLFMAEASGPAPLHGVGFVLTCTLLGALLGWLRLASRSVIPTTIANAILTLSAGLPLLLQGVEVGPRGAVYGPPGWLPMALVLAALALGRCRHAVKLPEHSAP